MTTNMTKKIGQAYRCPSCGRLAGDCWIMPCLGLETFLAQGQIGIRTWFGQCGFRVRIDGRNVMLSRRSLSRGRRRHS